MHIDWIWIVKESHQNDNPIKTECTKLSTSNGTIPKPKPKPKPKHKHKPKHKPCHALLVPVPKPTGGDNVKKRKNRVIKLVISLVFNLCYCDSAPPPR